MVDKLERCVGLKIKGNKTVSEYSESNALSHELGTFCYGTTTELDKYLSDSIFFFLIVLS